MRKPIEKNKDEPLRIDPPKKEGMQVSIIGTSPLLCNAMSLKARQELLLPAPKKNRAEKASTLKHNPLMEYRNSVYITKDDKAPTRIVAPCTWFKQSMAHAALDIPGVSKSEIGRLVYVPGIYAPIFGVPEIFMSIVRMNDMARTPDVRTRALIRHWATRIVVEFVEPNLRASHVVNLLSAAGITQGVGDGRPQKGKLDYGQYRIVNDDDPEFVAIVNNGGLNPQDAALASPEFADVETERLYEWFQDETKNRGLKVVA